MTENDPAGATLQARWSDLDPSSAAFQLGLATAHEQLLAIEGVDEVLDPTTIGPAAISTSGDAVLVTVVLDPALGADEQEAASARSVPPPSGWSTTCRAPRCT